MLKEVKNKILQMQQNINKFLALEIKK